MLHGLSGSKQKLHQLLRLSWSQGPGGGEKLPSSSKLIQERSRSFPRKEEGSRQPSVLFYSKYFLEPIE